MVFLVSIVGIGMVAITFSSSCFIKIYCVIDAILEILNNGYKIDAGTLDKYLDQIELKEKQRNNLEKMLDFIPGVNLIFAKIKYDKLKKGIMNDPIIKESLIPMTDKEKEIYSTLKGRDEKTIFMDFLFKNNDNVEFFNYIEGNVLILDNEAVWLAHERLLLLSYTKDEVEKLNNITNNEYILGKMDGISVAIIGIPSIECNSILNNGSDIRVRLAMENYLSVHTFKKMSDEEAKDKHFVVYPFYLDDKIKDNLDKCIDNIIDTRAKEKSKKSKDYLNFNMNKHDYQYKQGESKVLKRIRKK